MKILYKYIGRGYQYLVTVLLILFYAWPLKMLHAQDAESVKVNQKLSSDGKMVINNDLTSSELKNIKAEPLFENQNNQPVTIAKDPKTTLETQIKTRANNFSNKTADRLITVDKPGSYDTLIFYLGDGHYTVNAFDNLADNNYGNRDTLIFGDDITKDMVSLIEQDNNLIVVVGDQDDQITFTDYFKHSDYQTFNRFEFDDGTVWADIRDQLMKDEPMVLVGSKGDDTLIGGSGNDSITDTWGNNYIDGGAGDDVITGKGTLIGGKGNDTIYAQTNGSYDTFIFNLGDGQDTLYLYDYYVQYKDKLIFGEGINKEMISLVRTGDDLIMSIADGHNDQITIINYFKTGNEGREILYRLEFANGEVIADFRKIIKVYQYGTESNDTLNGYITNDVIYAGAGNDLISDTGGINYIEGGDGNDTITGSGTVLGGVGDDTITGAGTLSGGDGNDSITTQGVNNHVDAGDGDDIIKGAGTLIGGKGNDTIYAQTNGSYDTFIFNLGDGQDTLYLYDYYVQYKDKLIFGEGINKEMISLVRTGDDLIMSIADGHNDQITIINYFKTGNEGREILYRLEFANGEVIADFRKIIKVYQYGTESNDTLNGYITNDVIYAGAGNDLISDTGGINYIEGGDGNDTITGSGTVLGGVGDDTITGAGTLSGGDGNDSITTQGVNNHVDAGDGDDIIKGAGTLIGGKGNDTIYAQTNGSYDTFIFNLGDGQDTLYLYDYYVQYKDKLIFGEGINKEMISLVRTGDDLIMSIADGYNDQITFINYFKSNEEGREILYRLEFANGEVIADFRKIIKVYQYGTESNDTLNGYITNDVIYAGASNDLISDTGGINYIEGGDGNDTITGSGTVLGGVGDDTITGAGTLSGGDGNDSITTQGVNNHVDAGDGDDIIKGAGTLIGGKGNDTIYAQTNGSYDTFIFNLGDGQDTLYLYDYYVQYKDKLIFGEGINKEMISLVRTGDDLIMSIADGHNDQITIINYFKTGNEGRDILYRLEFADGSVIADLRKEL